MKTTQHGSKGRGIQSHHRLHRCIPSCSLFFFSLLLQLMIRPNNSRKPCVYLTKKWQYHHHSKWTWLGLVRGQSKLHRCRITKYNQWGWSINSTISQNFLLWWLEKWDRRGGEIHKIFWIFNMDGNNYINVEKLHHIQQI